MKKLPEETVIEIKNTLKKIMQELEQIDEEFVKLIEKNKDIEYTTLLTSCDSYINYNKETNISSLVKKI